MEMKELSPGEYVIKEGDIGDSFFVLATGKVRVSRRAEGGSEVILAYLTDGAFFGEMALLQGGPRTASVIVEEDSQLFEIKKELLDQVVARYPSVAAILKNFYKQRLLSTAMATHPLFRPFSNAERRQLMEMFKSRAFEAGSVLLEEGKKGTGLYLALYGSLEVSKDQDGNKLVLAELGPGDLFGEMSLLTGKPTVATVRAMTECYVLRLSKKKFDEVIMTHPQVLELVSVVSDERSAINQTLLSAQDEVAAGTILV
jgi:CRP-like cAMP-binding protein